MFASLYLKRINKSLLVGSTKSALEYCDYFSKVCWDEHVPMHQPTKTSLWRSSSANKSTVSLFWGGSR